MYIILEVVHLLSQLIHFFFPVTIQPENVKANVGLCQCKIALKEMEVGQSDSGWAIIPDD